MGNGLIRVGNSLYLSQRIVSNPLIEYETCAKGQRWLPLFADPHPQWEESFALHSSDSLLDSHQGSNSSANHC